MKTNGMKTANENIYGRCFVAIQIPIHVQRVFEKIQNELKTKIEKASWTKNGNFHLTLKFLGNVKKDTISDVCNALDKTTIKQIPFSLEFGGIGTFPNLSRPRVLWIGLKQGGKITTSLSRYINNALFYCDVKSNERFHPHVTLARLKKYANLRGYIELFEEYQTIQNTSMTVNEITLVKSELHPNGAIYTPIRRFHLSKE